METAKVDIQKLQLLNDRIAQCFEALNQVRLSVHGLSHTSGIGAQGFGQQGFGSIGQQGFMGVNPYQQQSPYQQNPYQQTTFQNPYQQNPYLSAGIGQTPWANPLAGLSHSNPFTVSPYGFSPQTQGINPLTQGINPLGQGIGAFGMSVDPYLAVKVAQTFPFAQLPISPIGV
jgi:hypothetical protein